MLSIGFDIGSSSVKTALVDLSTKAVIDVAQYPQIEMPIQSPSEGFAEQDPESWWEAICNCTAVLLANNPAAKSQIKSIGISYQMHGLVLVDKHQKVLRPAIIWCDSRATEIGDQAAIDLGNDYCFSNLLNSPGNFTASKLKWVKDNEPHIFEQIDKVLLPGDFIAMKFTGNNATTISGLSEGIFWDFEQHKLADKLMSYFQFDQTLIPEIVDTFSIQGKVSQHAATQTGLASGTPISYRAGDQPNNALSLGVLNPGEIAATGGTSGVVYGLSEKLLNQPNSGVNSFAHVNHTKEKPRIGQLLCINGAGSQYAWIRNQIYGPATKYSDLEMAVQKIPVGADGLRIIPFGNGAERMINNKLTGAQVNNLHFNIHTKDHLLRAALEGIAFSFIYGINLLKNLGIDLKDIRVGNDNLFQSEAFSRTIANLLNCEIHMMDSSGAIGAALASGVAVGAFSNLEEAFSKNKTVKIYQPENNIDAYQNAYEKWETDLANLINQH